MNTLKNKYFLKPRNRAFTLIELLTVIAVIAILAAILIPEVGKVRLSANSTKSVSNLRQLGIAVVTHVNENKGRYPSAYWAAPDGWHHAIYERIYEVKWRENVSQPLLPNSIFWSPVVDADLYRETDPTSGRPRRFCYAMNSYFQNFGEGPTGNNGPKTAQDGPMRTMVGNPAQTCLLGDSNGGMNFWFSFGQSFPNPGNTAHILFFDGHVESLTEEEIPASGNSPASVGSKTGAVFWRGGPVPGRIPKS